MCSRSMGNITLIHKSLSSFTQVTAAEEEGDTMTVDMVVAEVDMTTVGIKKRTRRKLITKLLG